MPVWYFAVFVVLAGWGLGDLLAGGIMALARWRIRRAQDRLRRVQAMGGET